MQSYRGRDAPAPSGACTVIVAINGTRNYDLSGTWTGILTWSNGGFGAEITSDCSVAKA